MLLSSCARIILVEGEKSHFTSDKDQSMINGRVRTIQSDLGLTIGAVAAAETARMQWELYPIAKRMFDVVVAAIMLIVLAPVMAVVALAIRLDSPGPIIFRQTRIGKNHRPFTFYKFRSMYSKVDAAVHQQFVRNLINGSSSCANYKLTGDKRITRVGALIRKTSLDELPQLFNVIKGDMSMVGPRPPIPYEVAEYKDWHHRRLSVTPGITGLWQVRGRSLVSFDDMVKMDIAYAEQRSITLDVSLFVQTVPAVLSGRGAR
jgi:lipopolysaccharide/colanic/teichoic acid biosynthesis glycosyltransferase